MRLVLRAYHTWWPDWAPTTPNPSRGQVLRRRRRAGMLLTSPVFVLTHVMESTLLRNPSSPPVGTPATTQTKVRDRNFTRDVHWLTPGLPAVIRHVQHDAATRIWRASCAQLLKLSPPLPRMNALQTGLRDRFLRDLPGCDGRDQAGFGTRPTLVIVELVEAERPRREERTLGCVTTKVPVFLTIRFFCWRVAMRVNARVHSYVHLARLELTLGAPHKGRPFHGVRGSARNPSYRRDAHRAGGTLFLIDHFPEHSSRSL